MEGLRGASERREPYLRSQRGNGGERTEGEERSLRGTADPEK